MKVSNMGQAAWGVGGSSEAAPILHTTHYISLRPEVVC
jgi:hypothetical protein